MNNNKQTSIQHLLEQIALKLSVEQVIEFLPLFEQAKAMHKKEMIEFADKMRMVSDVDYDGNIKWGFDIEEAYNETFNK